MQGYKPGPLVPVWHIFFDKLENPIFPDTEAENENSENRNENDARQIKIC
jgi:hypothetical protein